MLISKSLDTDLRKSEKQTLFRFSTLYILLTVIIISIFSFIYYELQKDLMLQQKKATLQVHSKKLLEDLKQLHRNFDKTQVYPRSKEFESAIYDNQQKLIFSTSTSETRLDKILYLNEGIIHLVTIPESYYLGAKYVIVKMKDDSIWCNNTLEEIILFATVSFLFMFGIGYILLRLFLKPMRDAIGLLDRFIKDTTHELNTPVSTIVANIEMIDKALLDIKVRNKINRIDIAAKTISNIYQDLTYITLGNKIISNNEDVEIQKLVEERVEYFTSLAQAKKITLEYMILNDTRLTIDRAKLSKLLDNLLSNALKYNKVHGSIVVRVDKNLLEVEDTGIGIAQKDITQMQERYTRFNKSSGGFGIGLSIVSEIAKEYRLNVEISSELTKGTKVQITW